MRLFLFFIPCRGRHFFSWKSAQNTLKGFALKNPVDKKDASLCFPPAQAPENTARDFVRAPVPTRLER